MNIMTVIFNGLSTSSILLITALGLAITFGLMRVINMAHGEFIMIGAYTTYVVQNLFSAFLPSSVFDAYYIVALFAAFGVAFAIGVIMEKLIVSRLYGNEIDSLLATWGVSLILQQLARSIFGAQPVNVKAPSFLQGNIGTGDITFSYVNGSTLCRQSALHLTDCWHRLLHQTSCLLCIPHLHRHTVLLLIPPESLPGPELLFPQNTS